MARRADNNEAAKPPPPRRSREAGEKTPAPGATTAAEVTNDTMIREFEEARQLAHQNGQAAAAVAAVTAKAKICGLLTDKPGGHPEPPAKFDGNYAEAARRVALLLRLGVKELGVQEPGARENKDRQKPDGRKAIEHKPDG